jgi:hypothetical protein
MNEISGHFRVLHNKELRDLYRSSSIVDIMKYSVVSYDVSDGGNNKCIQEFDAEPP